LGKLQRFVRSSNKVGEQFGCRLLEHCPVSSRDLFDDGDISASMLPGSLEKLILILMWRDAHSSG